MASERRSEPQARLPEERDETGEKPGHESVDGPDRDLLQERLAAVRPGQLAGSDPRTITVSAWFRRFLPSTARWA
jgi:hypothetical protein